MTMATEPALPLDWDRFNDALTYWCTETLNNEDTDEAREAAELATSAAAELRASQADSEDILVIAADAYTSEPEALRPLRLDELDLLRVVITVAQWWSLRDAAELNRRILHAFTTEPEALAAQIELIKDDEYTPSFVKHVSPNRFTEDQKEELRVYTINAQPATSLIEIEGTSLWLVFQHS